MLTTRGFWFFLVVFAALAAATIIGTSQLMLVCLTLLFWFLAQGFLFQLRIRLTIRNLQVERILRTSRGDVDSIWARQNVEIIVKVYNEGLLNLPYVVLMERLPEFAHWKDGDLRIDGALVTDRPLVLAYRIECPAPGRLRFEGIKLQLADFQGFFTFATFLRDPCEYRVLPMMAVEASHSSYVKQHNILPLLGTHRHARPGSSSELLDLRDYIPGDPPKMIAWKVSARRDRLITKEFESEVPIRCTLFLDLSNSVRLGPAGETALAKLVEIVAALAQANASERDLTGISLFDETGVRETIKAGRGSKHLLKMLGVLTRAASLVPHTPDAKLGQLLPIAYGLVQDVYPDWLDRDVNHFPAWLPIWSPQPSYTIPQPAIPSGRWWQMPSIWTRRKLARLPVWLHSQIVRRVLPTHHAEYRWRKEIAAILSVRYELGPGGLALLLEDDRACGEYVQRFLAEHQVAYPYPFYDDAGRYLFAAPEKATVLAKALLKAIAHGKDNELFVLCVDLLECVGEDHHAERDDYDEDRRHHAPHDDYDEDRRHHAPRDGLVNMLERAVCVAKARHHQVVVICPWPAAVAPPGSKPKPAPESLTMVDLHRLLLRASTARLHQAFAKLKHTFGRLGVPVICAGQDDTVDWILHRMRRLRVQERGVR